MVNASPQSPARVAAERKLTADEIRALGRRSRDSLAGYGKSRLGRLIRLAATRYGSLTGDAYAGLWDSIRGVDAPLTDEEIGFQTVAWFAGQLGKAKVSRVESLTEVFDAIADAVEAGRAAEQPAAAPAADEPAVEPAVWLGDGRVKIGDEPPITLEGQLADAVQGLVELGSATGPMLDKKVNRADCDKLLHQAVKKFPALAPYITFPGRRGKGGYRTTIQDKSKARP